MISSECYANSVMHNIIELVYKHNIPLDGVFNVKPIEDKNILQMTGASARNMDQTIINAVLS